MFIYTVFVSSIVFIGPEKPHWGSGQLRLCTLCPTGYRVIHIPRSHSAGGGVGIIFKNSIRLNTSLTDQYHSFELMDFHLRMVRCVRFLLVYRPPSLSTSLFLEEFSKLLEHITADLRHKQLLIVVNFNIHVDNPNDATARQFLDVLDSFDLVQHVSEKTHANGHTLDLVISNAKDHFVNEVKTSDPVISDHLAVHSTLCLEKPKFVKKVVSSRKLRGIDMTSFRTDVEGSVLLQHQDDIHVAVNNYDEVLRSLMDKYAPVKERVTTVRPFARWYTAEVTAEKQKRRRLEHKWRASRLPADHEQYIHQCSVVINLIKSLKSEYYSSIIKENSGNQKVLFKTVQKLLQKPTVNYYPLSGNDRMLADEFATFFTTKIETLHNDLLVKKRALIDSAECVTDEVPTMSLTKFSSFIEMTIDDIKKLAATLLSKSCILDPLPSPIIKECIDLLLPTITNIVNLSLRDGCMPTCLKTAVLSPLIKRPDADFLQFKNFRPISNLKALSKIIEKSVALQLNNYLRTNNLLENFQSAYKVHHSTETVMVKVQDDILRAIDDNMKPLYYLC